MNGHAVRSSANRARILAAATRNIAASGFVHLTRPGIMAGSGMHPNSLESHFGSVPALLAAICHAHALALAEATGRYDPQDATPPRAALVATAARILACIDAHPDAHTILMRDLPWLPAPLRAGIDDLAATAAVSLDRAWSALRPDLAPPERCAGLSRTLRTLLLAWPDWREPGPFGRPAAAADQAVAMVEASIDRPLPPPPALPPPRPHNPHAHWCSDEALARGTRVIGPVDLAPRDAGDKTPPIHPASRDAAHAAPRDALPPAPAHPGLTLRETLRQHGLPPTLAAARLGFTGQRLYELTRGTRTITPNTALRLEALLGERAETWLARQARHDVHIERARMET